MAVLVGAGSFIRLTRRTDRAGGVLPVSITSRSSRGEWVDAGLSSSALQLRRRMRMGMNRVLHVVDDGSLIGDAERLVLNLILNLRDVGWEPALASPEGELPEHARDAGIPVDIVAFDSRFSLQTVWRLAAAMRGGGWPSCTVTYLCRPSTGTSQRLPRELLTWGPCTGREVGIADDSSAFYLSDAAPAFRLSPPSPRRRQ